MTAGKTIALTRQTFVGKVMSLLFNMLSMLVITFLPRSMRLLISWLQSRSAVILEEPEIKLPTSTVSSKKQESSRKTSVSALLTMPKPLTVWITTNCEKFFKRWEYQTTWPAFWEICMQVRKQQIRTGHGTTDWFQTGKGIREGCILSPCLSNICRMHHAKCWAGWSTSWNQDCWEKY